MDKKRLLCALMMVFFAHTVNGSEHEKYVDEDTYRELQEIQKNSAPSEEAMRMVEEIYDQAFSEEGLQAIDNAMKMLTGNMDVYHMEAPQCAKESEEDIIIFISASMPRETVANYAKVADANTLFVLRGPVGADPSKIIPTLDYISQTLCGVKYTELLENTDCYEASIEINPPLFQEYGVDKVPTIIIKSGENTYKHVGAVPVSYLLNKIK